MVLTSSLLLKKLRGRIFFRRDKDLNPLRKESGDLLHKRIKELNSARKSPVINAHSNFITKLIRNFIGFVTPQVVLSKFQPKRLEAQMGSNPMALQVGTKGLSTFNGCLTVDSDVNVTISVIL